jgi:hypothetical protein
VVVTAIPVEQPLHLVLSIGKLESRDYNNAPYFPFLVAHGKDSKATVTVSALEGTKAEQSKVRLKILKVPLRKK